MWRAEYADGTVATEEEYGSVRHAPPGIIALAVHGQRLPIPEGATPLWLRRVALSVTTGRSLVKTMIGWEWEGERVEVWVGDDGWLTDDNAP